MYILQNETYKGDKLLQKTHPKDLITKRPDPRVAFESNYLENDHKAIVGKDVWDAVQRKISRNKELEAVVGHRGGQPHFLYGKVFCGSCGSPMVRRTVNGTGEEKCKVWVCRERFKGKQGKTKHTFAFMRKEIEDEKYKVSVTFASEFLKRNTDSVKCAMENDVFGTLPDNSLLDKLEVDA